MIKHRSPKIVLTVLGLFAFLIIPFNTVHAQTPSQAISLSPATTQVSIDPGKSASDKIEVINTGDDSFNVTFSVAPYYVTGQNYDPHFTQLPGTVDASKWITITSTKATLESHKVLAENYTISVPANTAPGGYYAVIFAETSQSNVSAGGVVPHNRVGNIVYITVNGDVKTSGYVKGSSLPGFTFSPTVPLDIQVANDGGVHFQTTASFSVKDITGKEVYSAHFDRLILPSTVRNITTSWTASMPVGVYTVHREATAAGTLTKLPDQTIVVVNPWFLIGLILIILAIVMFFVIRAKQRKSKR